MKIYTDIFDKIVSLENLFLAWNVFKKDKRNRGDVQEFEWNLEQNIFALHRELKNHTYKHAHYTSFYIYDPKRRHIHKAVVRDRVLHHALFRIVNPIFEETFIANSFSCRKNKGTHAGANTLESMLRKASKNYKKPCYALKCDIAKFFDSVNHEILKKIIIRRVKDKDALLLCGEIIDSYPMQERERERERESNKGLPIGNLTSQLFANIYLNEFDQFIKHSLKVKYYVRYTDDFIIVDENKQYLESLLPIIARFLKEKLQLSLHPNKVILRKLSCGIDFLGYVVLAYYKLLRAKTRRRIFKKLKKRICEYKNGKISKITLENSLQSYLGVLSHANTYKLSKELKNQFWFWLNE